jgi:hypothetical protein
MMTVLTAEASFKPGAAMVSDGQRKSREIEKAWRRHDRSQARVPAPVRRELKRVKRELATTAEVIEAELRQPARLADCIIRRGLARQRAIERAYR